jgi:acetyl-CoA carboxylase biotin carboxylase subunit
MKKSFKKILIANRGEIALRIIRACHEVDIKAVAVFSEPDRESLHVLRADEAYCVGPGPSGESYLVIDRIIETAKKAKCAAIHPGYGFLAENAGFSQACKDAGIVFIGPDAEAMRAMGDKTMARSKVGKAGVPIIPGMKKGVQKFEAMREAAAGIGYPVLIKAALGGGGKGMRVCRNDEELKAGFELCRKEAQSAFGDPKLYLEKYLEKPRHIEFQILADHHGNTIHLGERECSIQRRHQKLIEESPSVAIDDALRTRMGEAAVAAAEAVGYVNAGTIEFLLDADKNFYFLEMNTRLQVEHPVTEFITGVDLVHEQFKIAAGREMTLTQESIHRSGHAIECRIYAEDPDAGFLPSSGIIERLREPAGPGIRVDSGVYQGWEVPVYYDPLIAKLLCWAPDRTLSMKRMHRALSEYTITGVKTTIGFLRQVMEDDRFQSGDFDTHFIDESEEKEIKIPKKDIRAAGILAALAYHTDTGRMTKGSTGMVSRVNPWKFAGRREAME